MRKQLGRRGEAYRGLKIGDVSSLFASLHPFQVYIWWISHGGGTGWLINKSTLAGQFFPNVRTLGKWRGPCSCRPSGGWWPRCHCALLHSAPLLPALAGTEQPVCCINLLSKFRKWCSVCVCVCGYKVGQCERGLWGQKGQFWSIFGKWFSFPSRFLVRVKWFPSDVWFPFSLFLLFSSYV